MIARDERAASIWLGGAQPSTLRLEVRPASLSGEWCSLTIRELCERAKKLDEPLPEVIKYDLYPILGGATDLQAKLRLSETYSVAATCLLEFLTGRERNYQDQESLRKTRAVPVIPKAK